MDRLETRSGKLSGENLRQRFVSKLHTLFFTEEGMLIKTSYLPDHSHGWEKYLFGSFWSVQIWIFAA